MKQLTYLIMLAVLIASVMALDECRGTMNNNEIPCYILLPIEPTTQICSDINVTFYKNATEFLYNQTMSNFSYFNCNATFNGTSYGTYTFYYTTGDSGSIIVQEDVDNRYYLYLVFIVVFLSLIGLGYYKQENIFVILGGFMACAIALNLFLNGFPNLTNDFLRNTISIILSGLGFYFIIAPSIDYFENWRSND